MLSNNSRGATLVILVVVMTFIAVLGTALISLVGSKQKSAVYLIYGYRASVIADSGAEYAIRYISDGLQDTTKGYFTSLASTQSIGLKNYAGGTFKVEYYKDPNGDGNISDDYIEVISDYKNIGKSTVKISNFRRFLNPITFYPDYDKRPYRYDAVDSKQIVMPVIGNHDYDLTVSQIDLTMPLTGMYLQYIKLAGVNIFNYITDAEPGLPSCPEAPATPTALCVDSAKGVWLPATTTSFPTTNSLKLQSHTITADAQNDYMFQFSSTAPGSGSQYTVKLYPQLTIGAQTYSWESKLIFKPKATTTIP
ncbi:MAG: hypothetical protein A4E57_01799 [Syntrophorhabdaceae bacterium PtaU1.Bin034]|nr:MAG: hypothetical protein A4E57_01799 [Syntrophorhabdaceae bacterium PtaU1.Bin034]